MGLISGKCLEVGEHAIGVVGGEEGMNVSVELTFQVHIWTKND